MKHLFNNENKIGNLLFFLFILMGVLLADTYTSSFLFRALLFLLAFIIPLTYCILIVITNKSNTIYRALMVSTGSFIAGMLGNYLFFHKMTQHDSAEFFLYGLSLMLTFIIDYSYTSDKRDGPFTLLDIKRNLDFFLIFFSCVGALLLFSSIMSKDTEQNIMHFNKTRLASSLSIVIMFLIHSIYVVAQNKRLKGSKNPLLTIPLFNFTFGMAIISFLTYRFLIRDYTYDGYELLRSILLILGSVIIVFIHYFITKSLHINKNEASKPAINSLVIISIVPFGLFLTTIFLSIISHFESQVLKFIFLKQDNFIYTILTALIISILTTYLNKKVIDKL